MHARPPNEPAEVADTAAPFLEPCYTLEEASQIFYRGKLTKRALSRAFKKYDLPLEKIGESSSAPHRTSMRCARH